MTKFQSVYPWNRGFCLCLPLVLLILTAAAGRGADEAAQDDNAFSLDLSGFSSDRKVYKVKDAGQVKITVSGMVSHRTMGFFLADDPQGGARRAESAYSHAEEIFRRFRSHIGINTAGEKPLQHIFDDIRREAVNPGFSGRTQELYGEAEEIERAAAREAKAFWAHILGLKEGDRLMCEKTYRIKAEVATPRTVLISPCCRERDLKHLMDLVVKAAKYYRETVDSVRKDVTQQIQLQKAAAAAP